MVANLARKLLLTSLMFVFLQTVFISDASAATYYVDSAGSDTDDGLSSPSAWGTIQKAANIAVAGDTVNVSGSFTLTSFINIAHSGSEAQGWIRFNGNNNAILTGDGILNGDGSVNHEATVSAFNVPIDASYIKFDGFRIFNVVNAFTVGDRANNLFFTHNYIQNHSGAALGEWRFGHDITVDNNYIEGNGTGGSRAMISFGYPYNSNAFVENIAITNNTILKGGHNCIDLHTRNRNVLIENNTISDCTNSAAIFLHNFGDDTITIRNNHISNSSRGIWISGSKNILIEGNTIDTFTNMGIFFYSANVEGTGWGDGNGITSCGEVSNVTIRNNTIDTGGRYNLVLVEFYNACTLQDPDPPFSDFTFDGNNFINASDPFQNDFWIGYDSGANDTTIDEIQILNQRDSIYGDSYYLNQPRSSAIFSNSKIKYTDNTVMKTISGGLSYVYYPTYAEAAIPGTAGWTISTQIYPMTVTPASGSLFATVNSISKSADTWNLSVSSTVPENPTTFTLETLHPSTIYSVKRDNIEIATANTNSTGNLIYLYQTAGNEFDTTHNFKFVSTGVAVPSAHSLTVTNGTGSGSYAPGQSVTIVAGTPASGKEFDKWTGDTSYVSNINNSTTTVNMPSSAVSLTAAYKDISSGGSGSSNSGGSSSSGSGSGSSSGSSSSSSTSSGENSSGMNNDSNNSPDTPYPTGTLLKLPDSFKVYVIIDNKKKWISTPEVFQQLGYKWTEIKILTQTELNNIPDYEDNLIRVFNDYKVYLVVNGVKRHIPNPIIFLDYGFKWNEVKDVPQETIDKYKNTYLIKQSGSNGIYYVNPQEIRKLIPSTTIFNSYNDKTEDIQVISKTEMESYPLSNLIRLGGSNDIYLIEGNIKKHISSSQVFNKYKLSWNLVMSVNQTEFDFYQNGGELK